VALTTYHCTWCGWNGSRIQEQATGDGRYCCWQCGQEVKPGLHRSEPGYGGRAAVEAAQGRGV